MTVLQVVPFLDYWTFEEKYTKTLYLIHTLLEVVSPEAIIIKDVSKLFRVVIDNKQRIKEVNHAVITLN